MSHAKKTPLPGGELERGLLQLLWRRGEATGRDLFDDVTPARGIAYTTVTTVLDRLCDKGVAVRERDGRAFVYRAAVAEQETQKAMAREAIAPLAEGDPRQVAVALLGAIEQLSPELLRELEAELLRRRGRR